MSISEKRNINICLSDFVMARLNLYLRYVGISRSACIAYFLSEQIREFRYNNNTFMDNWEKTRYKPMATEMNQDGASEHLKRFSVSVSEKVYDDLITTQEKLNVSLPKLTTNMIVLELNSIFINYQVDISFKENQIEKEELRDKIPVSNIFRMRLDTIAKLIGIPRNALIAQALAEYLIIHYTEYDENNYDGVW